MDSKLADAAETLKYALTAYVDEPRTGKISYGTISRFMDLQVRALRDMGLTPRAVIITPATQEVLRLAMLDTARAFMRSPDTQKSVENYSAWLRSTVLDSIQIDNGFLPVFVADDLPLDLPVIVTDQAPPARRKSAAILPPPTLVIEGSLE